MQWSKEKAWEWYNVQPWLRGCNFMPSNCANRIDQWQAYHFDEHLAAADRELAAAADLGFNVIRVIVEYEVWRQEHDGFLQRFESYLQTAWRHGIRTLVVFTSDCTRPKRMHTPTVMGPQSYDWGYHGGRKASQHGSFPDEVGYHVMDDPEVEQGYYRMVEELIRLYAQDGRILAWELFNEIGNNNRGNMSLPYLKNFFAIARDIDPIQPLCADVFGTPQTKAFILENCDVITFHSYEPYTKMVETITDLQRLTDRPLMCTEWLSRTAHCDVETVFPLFYALRVGNFCWGLVAGLYQTYEPHEAVWHILEKDPSADFDVTKWMHDLLRPSLRPYDPKEIALIRHFCSLADKNNSY